MSFGFAFSKTRALAFAAAWPFPSTVRFAGDFPLILNLKFGFGCLAGAFIFPLLLAFVTDF